MSLVKGGRDLMYYPCQLEHRVILAPVSRLHLRDDILCVRVGARLTRRSRTFAVLTCVCCGERASEAPQSGRDPSLHICIQEVDIHCYSWPLNLNITLMSNTRVQCDNNNTKKLLEIEKEIAREVAVGDYVINTTWENLQVAMHKSVCWTERTAYWFVLCDLQIFSGKVYHPEPPHAQSPFLFPKVFGINLGKAI